MTTTTYSSNNSGGSWWLSDDDWFALENAGWKVSWNAEDNPGWSDKDGRFLGALATKATREGIEFRKAIQEWEEITGQDATELGCSCCGGPHSFYSEEHDYYSPQYPTHGDSY